jgi:hypothetical protein
MSKNWIKAGARSLCLALIVTTTAICTAPEKGWAMLAPAQATSDAQRYDRAADMMTVQTALESKVVRERLKSLGIEEKDVDARLKQLSGPQLHKLAKDIESVGPGGSVAGILVIVLLVVLIVYLVQRIT